MEYDTAGNPINKMIENCDCGLTGGCEKCNPLLWQKNYDWGEEKKQELREWKERFNKDFEEKRKRLSKLWSENYKNKKREK